MSAPFDRQWCPKILREKLCIQATFAPDNFTRREIGRLIAVLDLHRPLASNGKHGSLHTPTCGCEDLLVAALASATPPVAEQPRECEHTEHAIRGTGRVGRRFPKDGPDVGIWEPCPAALASAVPPTHDCRNPETRQIERMPGSVDECPRRASSAVPVPTPTEEKKP